jgi:hypothetical protein
VRGRLHRGLGDTLIWLAVGLGVLWLLIWADVAPGAASADVQIPAGLGDVAAFSTVAVLVPGVPSLAAWILGLSWARFAAMVTGAALIATSDGWTRVPDVTYLRWVALLAGIALVLFTLPWWWPALAGRGDASPLVARIGMGLLLLVVFAVGVTMAVVGWDIGLVNRRPEDDHGLDFLVPGLAVATACLALGRHYFPGWPRQVDQ